MNLKDWAESQGVSYITAQRWFHAGKLPVPARKVGGLILVDAETPVNRSGLTAVYARVSSSDQRSDLDRQVARVTAWATGQGMSVDRTITEVGSALNGKRRRLLALLRDPNVTMIIVEHRDRFARFGAEYVEAALSAQQRQLVVVDSSEVDDDLVRDVTEILASLCARLYGRRSAVNRARQAVSVITED